MRARNGRDRRARRGRYFLRDLAGLADIERLLATDVIRERRSPDVADDDASGDSAMMSGLLGRGQEEEAGGEHLADLFRGAQPSAEIGSALAVAKVGLHIGIGLIAPKPSAAWSNSG